jgi:hypothetical protein
LALLKPVISFAYIYSLKIAGGLPFRIKTEDQLMGQLNLSWLSAARLACYPFTRKESGGAMVSSILISIPVLAIVMAVNKKASNLSASNGATRSGEYGAQNNEVAASILGSLIDSGTIKYDESAKTYALAAGAVAPKEWKFIAGKPAKLEVYLCPSSNKLLPQILEAGAPPALIASGKCHIGNSAYDYDPVKVIITLGPPLPDCKLSADMTSTSTSGRIDKYAVRISSKGKKNWGPGVGRFISDGLYRDCSGPKRMGLQVENCPEGMAAFSLQDSEEVVIQCGVLPMADMLSSNPAELNIRRADGVCLANEVITGSEWVSYGVQPPTDSYVLCSKINTTRYQLGPAKTSGYFYWGSAKGASGDKGASVKMNADNMPGQIRYLMGRKYYPAASNPTTKDWDPDGCFGYDASGIGDSKFGLLMSAKRREQASAKVTSKYCGDMEAKRIEYKGLAGDPPLGTAVDMFPQKCSDISDQGTVFDGTCIP